MAAKEKRTVRIIGERNICLHLSNPNHQTRIMKIGKALSSATRLKILDMLKYTPALFRKSPPFWTFLCPQPLFILKHWRKPNSLSQNPSQESVGPCGSASAACNPFIWKPLMRTLILKTKPLPWKCQSAVTATATSVRPADWQTKTAPLKPMTPSSPSMPLPAPMPSLSGSQKDILNTVFQISVIPCYLWVRFPFPWRSVRKLLDS